MQFLNASKRFDRLGVAWDISSTKLSTLKLLEKRARWCLDGNKSVFPLLYNETVRIVVQHWVNVCFVKYSLFFSDSNRNKETSFRCEHHKQDVVLQEYNS